MPVNPDRLEPGAFVVDITTATEATPLCRAAQARGCRTLGGRAMHEGQAVYAFRFLGFDYRPNGRSASNDLGLPSPATK
jgi:shikimate dehydrogenase